MNSFLSEDELEFDFSGCQEFEKFDFAGKIKPEGFQQVDFIIEEKDRIILIEVKDPSNSSIPPEKLGMYLAKLKHNELINSELVPKARDSWTFLYLMNRTNKPVDYVCLICIERIQLDPALLQPFQDRLQKRLRQETHKPLVIHYIRNCQVVTLTSWHKALPSYSVIRKHSSGS